MRGAGDCGVTGAPVQDGLAQRGRAPNDDLCEDRFDREVPRGASTHRAKLTGKTRPSTSTPCQSALANTPQSEHDE